MMDLRYLALPIPGAPGYYARRDGVILSMRKGLTPRVLKPRHHHRTKHARVRLYGTGAIRQTPGAKPIRYRDAYVHVLVARTWLGSPPEEADLVRHINGEPGDNEVENLTYGTHADNAADREAHRLEREALQAERDIEYTPPTGIAAIYGF